MANQSQQQTITVIPRLLTSADVAERLQVNIRTAQKIMRSIPHINIGTGKKNEHLRITEDMLEEYINARIVMPSRPVLNNQNPQIVPQIRAAGTGKIARRPVR